MKKHTELGKSIIAGLKEAIDCERGKISLKSTALELPPPAPKFSKREIIGLRVNILHVSQPIFARFLNVSPSTVKAWEQGVKEPSGSATRLLQIIIKDPKKFTELVIA